MRNLEYVKSSAKSEQTFFGMNLTALSNDTGKLGFAHNWWLFLAVAIPLTVLTVGVLAVAWILERRKRKKIPLG